MLPHRTQGQAIVVMAALAGFALSAGVASARPVSRLVVSPDSGAVGTRVSVRASGLPPRVNGLVVFDDRTVASFRTTTAGSFATRFAVPRGRSVRAVISTRMLGKDRGADVSQSAHTTSFKVTAPRSKPGSTGSKHGGSNGGGGGSGAGTGSTGSTGDKK